MPLEKVILYGFKSFADKTEATLTPGITGIVGPNGCGKSNISDAIRWALGEQSAKSLRGHRMEDIIFHGSASRKPIGMAEVSLIFGNEDGVFQLPVNQVMVTRRLYRDGESEYLLNKTPAKLRDITDLFLGTGVSIVPLSGVGTPARQAGDRAEAIGTIGGRTDTGLSRS